MLKRRGQNRFIPRLRKGSAGQLGVVFSDDMIVVAEVNGSGQIISCHSYSLEEVSAPSVLRGAIAANNWQRKRCSLILRPGQYQLLLTQMPDVAELERNSALRWQIKDLLDIPVEQAAIDCFPLPDDAYYGRKKMTYAAAASKELIGEYAELLEDAGLDLASVQVAEIAMHKLMRRVTNEASGVAMLFLDERRGFVNLCNELNIYQTRGIDVPVDLSSDLAIDTILLEIQRSLDYYERQLGKGVISCLYHFPFEASRVGVARHLEKHLGLPIEQLEYSSLFDKGAYLDEESIRKGILAIAGAMDVPVKTGRKQAVA